MRKFLEVYNTNKDSVNESKRINADKERVALLKAIKREYGVSDFKSLSESEVTTYKKMIHNMWSPETGLNEAGLKFVNESQITLTADSSADDIKKVVKQMFKENIFGYFEGATGKRFTGNSAPVAPSQVRHEVEKATGKKYNPESFKKGYMEVLFEVLSEKLDVKQF